MNTNLTYQASGLLGWVDGKVGEVNSTVATICVAAGVIIGIVIIVKNPTVGRSIIGIMVGAFIASLPWLIPGVGAMIRGDVEAAAPPVSSVEQFEMTATGAIAEGAGPYELVL